ncbi:MAG: hypothetical protein ACE5JA_10030 [bacterium]
MPREGVFVRSVENLGRKLILVDFGEAGREYLFPHEVESEKGKPELSKRREKMAKELR